MRRPDVLALLAKILTRPSDRVEIAEAQRVRDLARVEAAEDHILASEAREVAERLRRHRQENHFAQRMRAAYRGEHPA
ncbi:hypothetical protein EEW87_16335 [Janibacter melonis]|uniref:Uncharacterized protein n=1 Tax=Janibacter melonis TaxID=262209 RepID=A0A650GE36_9MICO|nr:hypothetical protein [Janibacter melonis]QGX08239.1 hypothetical protein EEW87_16335 [Janibacter melonis]